MALTKKQQETFYEWVNKHNPDYKCPICGGNNFLTDDIIAPTTLNSMKGRGQIEAIPMVPLSCSKCGYITFFSTKMIGL